MSDNLFHKVVLYKKKKTATAYTIVEMLKMQTKQKILTIINGIALYDVSKLAQSSFFASPKKEAKKEPRKHP